jgi:hypothetical protein
MVIAKRISKHGFLKIRSRLTNLVMKWLGNLMSLSLSFFKSDMNKIKKDAIALIIAIALILSSFFYLVISIQFWDRSST